MQPAADDTAPVSRRAALGFAAAAVALAAGAARAADGHEGMDHSTMDHSQMTIRRWTTPALIIRCMLRNTRLSSRAPNACIAKGEVCVAHCMDLIKGGDTAMVECMRTVSIMMR